MRRISHWCGLLLLVASTPARGQGSVVGTVFDSLRSGAPLANATVVLVERARYATTDAKGRFRIDDVPEGQYSIGFSHALLDSLDLQLPPVRVSVVGRRRASVALTTPTPHALYTTLCGDTRDVDLGVIVGVVRNAGSNRPLSNAIVSTEWSEFGYAASGTTREQRRATVTTDPLGVFRLCHVPTQVALDVVATRDDAQADTVLMLLNGERYGRADLMVTLSEGTTPTRAGETPTIAAVPATVVSTVASAARVDTVRSLRAAPTLARVTVTARAGPASFMERGGFDTRRRQGLGAFLWGDELARVRAVDLASTLTSMRGIRVWSGMPYLRGMKESTCIPNYFVDGVPFHVDGPRPAPRVKAPFTDLSDAIPPERIRGIEVYASPGTIPIEYDRSSSTGCGSIVIWTR